MQNKAIEVIRHSLAAANAALDLLEPTQATDDTVGLQVQEVEVQAAPQAVEVQASQVEMGSLSDRLYDELSDSEYDLRTVAELCGKFGITAAVLYESLDDMDYDYVTKTRRSDGAPLVGLSSRN